MKKYIYTLLLLLITTLTTQAQTSLLPGSLLADVNDETTISGWLGNNCAVGTLLYRKSVNGASSYTFHNLCDNQGPTLVLIKNDATNTVFGGFANASWQYYGSYLTAPGSFLFNLTTDTKADLKNTAGSYAMYSYYSQGPSFGSGHDIYISSNMTSGDAYNFGYTYQCAAGSYGSQACWESLIGSGGGYSFNAGEIEVYKVELCGIKTGNVVANAAYCAGNNISVDYTSVGITYTAGNVFTAQLSDATGSFASPVNIGTLTSTAVSGTINAVLPAGVSSGSGYKLRVISSQSGVPSLSSSNSFIIGHAISASVVSTTHCAGSPVQISYTVSGCQLGAGNVFTAELSDASGSFASPTILGTLATNSGSGVINGTLPTTVTVSSNSYKVRVTSSQPGTSNTSLVSLLIGNRTSISYSSTPCVGTLTNVSYTYTGCSLNPGNVYNVELSNASGSFASPVVIGTSTSNTNSGTIQVAIPTGTPTGSGYQMRVTTSNPPSDYMATTSLSVGTGTISADYNQSTGHMCGGGTGTVNYNVYGCSNLFQPGNVFTAQLSDINGSFSSPTNIGSITTTDPNGTINITLPAGLQSTDGYDYRIRVVSSNPPINGYDSYTYYSSGITAIYLNSYPSSGLCAGGSISVGFNTYGCTPNSGNIYRLQMSTNSSFSSTTNIGSLTSTATNGTVTGTIPAGTTGTRYFRVVSTNPVQAYSEYFIRDVGKPVITVGTVADDCPGSMLPVPYSTTGCSYASGNVFTVELSDNNGYFGSSNPVVLGNVTSTTASGTLNVGNIPSSTPYSHFYRVRVKSSNPASDWAYSGYFIIGRSTYVYPNTSLVCPGASVGFSYSVTGCNPSSGNTYTLQLSSNGSFSSPTNLATLTSQATSGTITATIPSSLAGGYYYVRLTTSNANGSYFDYSSFYVGLETDITGITTSPYCPGTSGVVSYITNGCTPQSGNVFTVEMDDDYSFGSPIVIGTKTSTSTNSTINVTWPTTMSAGYRYIRVKSSKPSAYYMYYTSIYYGSVLDITNSISSPQCPGAALTLNYTTSNCTTLPTGNVFTAELSDGNGSFTTPTIIGTKTTTAGSGTVNVTLPANLPAGYFRIRLISNMATVGSDYTNTFNVGGSLSVPGTIAQQCAGANFNVGYNTAGCTPLAGNVFTVQLSDTTGNFTNPTVIGTLSGTAGSGSIPCNIPANTPQGSFYRVRVNSSLPANLSSSFSNYFQIGYTLSISGLAAGYCPGATIPVNYTSTCVFNSGNVLNVYLSDAFGNFTYATHLAAVSTTASSGTINVTLPQNIAGGSGYRLQVKSTNPVALNSVISNAFTVGLTTTVSSVASPQCIGGSFNVSYTTTGCAVNTGNVYQVLLGNTVIGTLISNATSGSIPVNIPANFSSGTYSLRVQSSSPVATSTQSVNLSIGSSVTVGTLASNVCAGTTFSIPITLAGCTLPTGTVIEAYNNNTNATMGTVSYVTGTNSYTITATAPLGVTSAYIRFRTTPVNYLYSSPNTYMAFVNNNAAITVTASPDFIAGCGTSQLNVTTKTTLSDNFNSGVDYTNDWYDIVGATTDNDCGAQSGNALRFYYYYDRYAVTKNMDVSGGGTIAFYLKMPTTNNPGSGCDDADAGEDVLLQYSTNDGSSWTTISTYSATSTAYANFTSISVTVPTAARTFKTRFRWIQPTYSGSYNSDTWCLDNVSITGTSSLTYAWTPTSTLSSSTIKNPVAKPAATTDYVVKVTSPNITCAASKSITVGVGNLTGVDPALFTYYGTSSGKHYYSSNATAVWATAKTNCEASCGNLVAINSSAEQTYVQGILPTVSRYIGLSDAATEGTYAWVTGETYSYTNWGTGQPNAPTTTTDYIRMIANTHTWDDVEGTTAYRYILERLANQNIVTSTSTPTSLCSGANYTIAYTANGAFDNGNVFTVQLSSATGSFSSPTVIGTLTSTVGGVIPVTIPTLATTGTAYRVRVVSSSPAVNGSNNGSAITIIGTTPNVSSVLPLNSPAGSIVTISGSNFSDVSNLVTFNGTPATVMSQSTSSIKVVVPSGACPGDLVVTTNCGSVSAGVFYDPNSTPTISGVIDYDSPLKLNITGTGFSYSGNMVTIAGQPANIFYQTPTLIKVDVPNALCNGPIVITNACGISSAPFSFSTTVAPSVLNVAPVSVAPGSTITVAGNGFATSGNSATYGGVAATIVSESANLLEISIPITVCSGNLIITNACNLSSSPFLIATSTANTTWYLDADGDGWYLSSQQDCNNPGIGWTDVLPTGGSGDCNDSDDNLWDSDLLYIDLDGDGYDNGSETICYGSVQPSGYSTTTLGPDCDDNNNAVWQTATLYVDADADGYDNGTSNVCYGLTLPTGYTATTLGADCNDGDNSLWQSGTFFIDADGDTYDAGTNTVCYGATVPLGYSSTTSGDDCDDNDNTKWEIVSLYIDVDADGYDDGFVTLCNSNTIPSGYSATTLGSDCDDNDGSVWQLIDGYADNDGDGYTIGGLVSICSGSSLPTGYSTSSLGTDCDDNNNTLWQSTTLYIDADNDNYDNGTSLVCYGANIPAGYKLTTLGPDCNDSNPAIFLGGITWYQDLDNDGYYANTQISCINPGAGWSSMLPLGGSGDCDDNDVNAWQTEQRYEDTDGDGFGAGSLVTLCFGNSIPAGYSTNNTDCAPSDNTKWQLLSGYVDDDGDGYTGGALLNNICSGASLPSGYSATSSGADCDDADNTVWQSATLYIDADNDDYDNGTATVCYGASIPSGYKATTLGSDCDDADNTVWQSATLYIDADNDNYDNGTDVVCYGASIPTGYKATTLGSDCNDNNAAVHPGATEVCGNGIDEDCNGSDLPCSGSATWTGAVSTAWNLNGNWSGGTVPGPTANISIPNVTNKPVISTAVTTGNITLAANATLTVAAGGSLTLNGTFANSGAVTIQHDGHFLQGPGSSYSGSGTFTVEKNISNTADGYRQVSAPVNTKVSGLADDFPIFGQNNVNCWYAYTPYPNVQIYDEAANNNLSTPSGAYNTGWISKTGLTNTMAPAQGFAVRTYQGAPFTLDFTGKPNNGAYNRTITLTPTATPSEDGWNFVGNAYPSSIDWVATAAINPHITGAYYVFNTTGEYTGNWGSCNSAGACTGLPGLSSTIASGQGFFVKATQNGSFTLNNSVRTATNANYYKTTALTNEIRLQLSGNGNADEILSYTDANATLNEDMGLDALKIPAGSTVYMSYQLNNKEYAINVFDQIGKTTELPLVIQVLNSGTYLLNATELNIPGITAYLKDAAAGTTTPLSTNGTGIPLELKGGVRYEGRFSIVFNANRFAKTTDSETLSTETATRIYSYNNIAVVERSSEQPATITIFNLLGQTIKEVNTNTKRTEIELDNSNAWYAVVKVKEAGSIKTEKVLIK